MIELGVEPQRKSVLIAEEEPAHYLILGDFGGGVTEPLAIDRDNLDSVIAKVQVGVEGVPFRELEDFHPDRLFRNLKLFREFDPAQTAGLGERMRDFLHHPRFQAVEAAWRGLDFVIRSNACVDSSVRIRIAHLPKAEAASDLGAACHSGSFVPGSGAAPLPVAPALRRADQRDRLISIRRNAVRAGSCALLWGNPALAFLTLLTAGGALNLEGLPIHSYQQDGDWQMTPCSEVWMTETQILALIDLGLMPLVSFRDSDRVRLAGFRAINGDELALRSA